MNLLSLAVLMHICAGYGGGRDGRGTRGPIATRGSRVVRTLDQWSVTPQSLDTNMGSGAQSLMNHSTHALTFGRGAALV